MKATDWSQRRSRDEPMPLFCGAANVSRQTSTVSTTLFVQTLQHFNVFHLQEENKHFYVFHATLTVHWDDFCSLFRLIVLPQQKHHNTSVPSLPDMKISTQTKLFKLSLTSKTHKHWNPFPEWRQRKNRINGTTTIWKR